MTALAMTDTELFELVQELLPYLKRAKKAARHEKRQAKKAMRRVHWHRLIGTKHRKDARWLRTS